MSVNRGRYDHESEGSARRTRSGCLGFRFGVRAVLEEQDLILMFENRRLKEERELCKAGETYLLDPSIQKSHILTCARIALGLQIDDATL